MIDLTSIFHKLDEIGKFIKFNRKLIIQDVKASLAEFAEQCNILEKDHQQQKDQFQNLEVSYHQKEQEFQTIKEKYDLVSGFLSAKPVHNPAMENFHKLISEDFIEFANKESSLAEEATALLILQDVEKRLQEIVTFPSIYNKNIVAVGGGFSAGKSEFLNSFFLDTEIRLPVGINPVTAIPTYITVGDTNIIKGFSYKGGVVELKPETYKNLSHDYIKSLEFNLKEIAPIMAIETPMKSYQYICFVDTPGYNPSNTGYTDKDNETSQEYLKHANTLLWVIGIDTNGTIPASDLEFLENMTLEDKKVFIIANKADLRSLDDIESVLDVFEDILDEYDIPYEGISAFSSINKEEITFRKNSIFQFLDDINNPVEVQKSILNELKNVFSMYRSAINEQIDWLKSFQKHLKSLELDFIESGVDIDESEQISERVEKMKTLLSYNDLKNQLKHLEKLENKIIEGAQEIFLSLTSNHSTPPV